LNLTRYGWDEEMAAAFGDHAAAGRAPARVALQVKGQYLLLTEAGEMAAVCSGRLRHEAIVAEDLPVVGDCVAVTSAEGQPPRALIHAVLPRRSLFRRKEAGARSLAQPLAANVDTVLITVGLDGDFSINRIERYLALTRESGAAPVILLTKTDLCPDVPAKVEAVRARAPGAPVIAISNLDGTGVDEVSAHLLPGRTCALLGSSGVGKSTLLNRLLGVEAQKTREVRLSDSTGRHTTTNRQLFVLPSGALMIDSPGMRELQLWDAGRGVEETFAEIVELASRCRFPDCRHADEPGCAVTAAVREGTIDPARLENYRKLSREVEFMSLRQEEGAARAERARWKGIHKEIKRMKKG
jgi:ribosome biogenesis GTPase